MGRDPSGTREFRVVSNTQRMSIALCVFNLLLHTAPGPDEGLRSHRNTEPNRQCLREYENIARISSQAHNRAFFVNSLLPYLNRPLWRTFEIDQFVLHARLIFTTVGVGLSYAVQSIGKVLHQPGMF